MNQAPLHGQFYIQQVAAMTGLSKQVIRKWEERYDLVHPERLKMVIEFTMIKMLIP